MERSSSESDCSIDYFTSSSSESDKEECITPKKKRYKRSLHHGFNMKRASYFHVTPDKVNTILNSGHSSFERTRAVSQTCHSLNCYDLSSELDTNELSNSSISDINEVWNSNNSSSECSSPSDCDTSSSDQESPSFSEFNSEESDNENNTKESHYDEPLYEGCKHTLRSLYTMVMLLVMKHSLAREVFTDILLLVSSILPENTKFSTSVYKLKEMLKRSIGLRKPTIHNYCEDCQQYLPSGNKCDNVLCVQHEAKQLQFHDLHMEKQLKTLCEDDTFLSLISHQKQKTHTDERLHDIVDGEVYTAKMSGTKTADLNLTLTMNTDGVALFSSSKKGSLWPVYLAINELPIKLRFTRKYLITSYLHCQVEKPNMLTYLSPMMTILQRLHTSGFYAQTKAGKMLVKVDLIAVSVDLPARAMVLNMKQFNGKSACSVCLDQGETLPGKPMHRFYPFKDQSEPRTHISILQDAETASRTGESANGVKGASALMVLKYIDLPKLCVIDWMHCVLLGVTKAMMNLWFNSKHKNESFFIGDKIALLNQRLLRIKIPDFISRRQRTLEDHTHWKASECREWLIHFSMPVLYEVLSPTPYIHFLLLVTAMCLLTKDGVSTEEVSYAKELLENFCQLYPVIYGTSTQTMNIHMLKHLADMTNLHGPLFAYSCFGFESMNSYLKRMVHGTRHINNQLCFAVGMAKQISSLVRQYSENNSEIKELAICLGSKFIQEERTSQAVKALGKLRHMKEDNMHYDILTDNMKMSNPYVFMRMSKDESVFFSKDNQTAKTKNSFTVLYLDDFGFQKYGFVLCYVKVVDNMYAVIRECRVNKFTLDQKILDSVTIGTLLNFVGNLCPHVVRVSRYGNKVLVPVENVLKKCVFMEINHDLTFISVAPNYVEHG